MNNIEPSKLLEKAIALRPKQCQIRHYDDTLTALIKQGLNRTEIHKFLISNDLQWTYQTVCKRVNHILNTEEKPTPIKHFRSRA